MTVKRKGREERNTGWTSLRQVDDYCFELNNYWFASRDEDDNVITKKCTVDDDREDLNPVVVNVYLYFLILGINKMKLNNRVSIVLIFIV